MEKNKLSNQEIVTIALYELGKGVHSFDLEEIAKKADELAPGRFRWRNDPGMISDSNVWDALSNARKKNYILEKTTKYLLTETGILFAKKNLSKVIKYDQTKSRMRGVEKEVYENTKNRLISTPAYQKAKNNKDNEIDIKEANQFFRVNDYMTILQKKEKVQKIKNLFINDKEFKKVVDKVANRINQEVK